VVENALVSSASAQITTLALGARLPTMFNIGTAVPTYRRGKSVQTTGITSLLRSGEIELRQFRKNDEADVKDRRAWLHSS
jgi:hypothetical protein